ncbi:hypothetical protein [Streptomyces phytophilus]|uniref:hypothetical protein n=1 Tax=Streptomyces phytophilus TaxID=722715 RepID=UPI0015F036A8|nr:hypothetical protein [Streptomyces phytophilus]
MSSAMLSTVDLISLYDEIFLNGGFTVSYGADGSLAPVTSGYVVSTTPRQHVMPGDVPFGRFAAALENLHARYLTSPAVGAWVDGDLLYLDPVEIHSDRWEAERLGRLRSQQAIFDLDRKEEIRL